MTKRELVARAMRQLIADGYWEVGDSVGDLWSLQEQSEKLFGVRVSWGTIRAAQQDLVDEGLLSVIQPGMPTRVVAKPSRPGQSRQLAELRALHAKLGDLHAGLGQWIARAS